MGDPSNYIRLSPDHEDYWKVYSLAAIATQHTLFSLKYVTLDESPMMGKLVTMQFDLGGFSIPLGHYSDHELIKWAVKSMHEKIEETIK